MTVLFALSLKRHTNGFAAVENISMRFCISLTHRKKFSSQHFRKWEHFSFHQAADRTIRTEQKLASSYKHLVPDQSGLHGGILMGLCPKQSSKPPQI